MEYMGLFVVNGKNISSSILLYTMVNGESASSISNLFTELERACETVIHTGRSDDYYNGMQYLEQVQALRYSEQPQTEEVVRKEIERLKAEIQFFL